MEASSKAVCTSIVFTTLMIATLSVTAVNADQVVLKNGDTLTGTVTGASRSDVSLNTELAGHVTIAWSAVTTLNATAPFKVVLADGKTVEGRPSVASGRLSVQPVGGGRVTVDVASARSVDVVHPPAAPSWHGTINGGLDLSRGNSETTSIVANGTAVRLGPVDRVAAYGAYLFSASGSGSDSVTTARAERGGIRYDHDVLGPVFGFGFADAENDLLELLDLRTVFGGGLGAHVVKTPTTQFNVFGGASYARDAYAATTSTTTGGTTGTSGPPITPPGQGGTPPGKSGVHPSRGGTPPTVVRTSSTRQVSEFLAGQDLVHQLSNSVSLTESFTFYPAVTDFQDYRIAFDLSLSAQLNGWLQWNVTVADRYLNIPPAGGAVQNDKFISAGLGITFGRTSGGTYSGTDGRRAAPPKKP